MWVTEPATGRGTTSSLGGRLQRKWYVPPLVPTLGRRAGRGEGRPAARGRGSQGLATPFPEQLRKACSDREVVTWKWRKQVLSVVFPGSHRLLSTITELVIASFSIWFDVSWQTGNL